MEVVGAAREPGPPHATVSWDSSPYRSFWDNYRWAWNTAWQPSPVRTELWVETLVYSLDPDDLLWVGRSRTVSPRNVAGLFGEVAGEAAREMERAGLLKPPAR
jgi:hypothetical protein